MQDSLARRGFMLVLSSPSGAGKTTLSRRLLTDDAAFAMSVSATTRPRRGGEVEGQDYFFVTPERFAEMVAGQAFLEHATVFGHSYGTPRAPVEEALAAGRDVLFDIDWQGTQQLHANSGKDKDLVRVFILPPSVAELERRLHRRAQDSAEAVRSRMTKAAGEMSHWGEYDYVIVNDSVEKSLAELLAIVQAERLRRNRRTGLVEFVRDLMRNA
ncbi:MAG: guanylate kinase [Rhodospirillales bacterium]|nr:guanylate kinase [Rhodospirillales bacterium]